MSKIPSLFLAIITSMIAYSQPDALDVSYNNTGKYFQDFGSRDYLLCAAISEDQSRIVTAGFTVNEAQAGQLLIICQHMDGSYDGSFDDDGVLILNNYFASSGSTIHVGSDGKITVAGMVLTSASGFADMAAWRFNPDGSPDNTFGSNGAVVISNSITTDDVAALAIQSDGKIVLAGNSSSDSNTTQPTMIRLNEDGTIDDTFGANGLFQINTTFGLNSFTSVVIDSQGRILACGNLTTPGFNPITQEQFIVIRMLSDGTLDTSFATEGIYTSTNLDAINNAFDLITTAENKTYVCGSTRYLINPNEELMDAVVYALDENGNLDGSFAEQGIFTFDKNDFDVFKAMQIGSDQALYLAGTSGMSALGSTNMLLASIQNDGSVNSAFNSEGYVFAQESDSTNEAQAMAIQADGKIILAGNTIYSNRDVAIMRFMGIDGMKVNEKSNYQFTIWPNPAKAGSTVQLSLQNTSHISSIQFVNEIGQVVSSELHQFNNQFLEIPTKLSSGVYHVVIQFENESTTNAHIVVN